MQSEVCMQLPRCSRIRGSLRVQQKEELIVRLGVKDNNPTAYRPWPERAVTGA